MYKRRSNFSSWCILICSAIVSFCFMLIPEAIAYGLYNIIDPITEIGRIIAVVGLVCITSPFAVWFVILGAGLFGLLLAVFE